MEWRDLSSKRSKEKRVSQKADQAGGRLPFPDSLTWHAALWAAAGILLVWLASGLYIIRPGEVGIIRRFGRITEVKEQGGHYHLPAPIEKLDRLQVKEIKSLEIGFRTVDPGPPARYRENLAEARMLVRDENIMVVKAAVKYQITDPRSYLFNIQDQEKTIRDAAESALRQVIGQNTLDSVLTGGKHQIQQETVGILQGILDLYQTGVKIISIELQDVHPPMELADAFKNAATARDERDKLVNEAQGQANEELAKARAEAARMTIEAESYRDEIIRHAEGDSARFLKNYAEYRGAEEVIRRKLYLETLEQILPEAHTYVLLESGQRFIGVLPFGKEFFEGLEPKAGAGPAGAPNIAPKPPGKTDKQSND
ncbi:MAG: FtsH protease activity modulator HflK [bacterium]